MITIHHAPVYNSIIRNSGSKEKALKESEQEIDESIIKRIYVGVASDGNHLNDRINITCSDNKIIGAMDVEAWVKESPQELLDSIPTPVPVKTYSIGYSEDTIKKDEDRYVNNDFVYITRFLKYFTEDKKIK